MRDYFCGWYFKAQSKEKTLALIAAYHRSKNGASSSVQIITDDGAWNAVYPFEAFRKDKRGFRVSVGGNSFSREGLSLDIDRDGLRASGRLEFGEWTPLKYDVMGPFAFVPFMECRHSVLSMYHTVNGSITLNGEEYVFTDGKGYIEGDRGSSFPSVYSWTQALFDNGSLMLSVAEIPFGPFRFTGVIGAVLIGGREHRVATYLGARAKRIAGGELVIKQGSTLLTAKLIEKRAMDLAAPVKGEMTRTIRESASCRAAYRFEKKGAVLLDEETPRASFEYEYPDKAD